MNQDAREKQVIRAFRETEHPDLTVREVSEELDVHYHTARKYIKHLESKGVIIQTRSSGMTKLYDLTRD